MKDEITQSDGFANGMLLMSAAAYPAVRGVAGAVGGVIDSLQRKAIIANAATLTKNAGEIVALVKPRMEAIDRALGELGLEDARRSVQMAMVYLQDRINWFSPKQIRDFVEANEVMDLLILNAMAEHLVEPVREAVAVVHKDLGSKDAPALRKQLLDLEFALVKFAFEKMKAEISRSHEPNYMARSSIVATLRIVGLLGIGVGILAATLWMFM